MLQSAPAWHGMAHDCMDTVDTTEALALARRHWAVDGEISRLPSYMDQNFRIRGTGGDFVLKVAHPSWARSDLDLENCAMLALAAHEPELHWPRVQRSVDGAHLLTVPVAGQTCLVRMLSFVPGATYAEIIDRIDRAQRASLHESLGAVLGRLSRALRDFRHPAAGRRHAWNLLHLPDLQKNLDLIDEAALRARVASHVQAFADRLPRWQTALPMALLHNDANDRNVIVGEHGDGHPQVTALIDFGDMCSSFRVAELAIACSYAMQHEADRVACAQDIIRGYLAHSDLQRAELEQLHGFIIARLCQSILMAARAQRDNPDNHYISTSQHGVRELLRELTDIAPDAIAGPYLEHCHE